MVLNRSIQQRDHSRRAGFTLVELLISVTLVLLMMTMFTAIFEMATDSVSTQRGIANNNQKARGVVTALKADISKRTFRYVLPFVPKESDSTSATDFGERAGYLYISTNDPDSWNDAVLQFTANVTLTQEDTDDTQYFGSSKLLYDIDADPTHSTSGSGGPRRTTLRFNPNQPDADDGNLNANNVGGSSTAEVCYFVRNGGLYRRVMLLRKPLPVAGRDFSVQPSSSIGNSYFLTRPAPSGGTTDDFGGLMAVVGSPLAINQTDSSLTEHFALDPGDDVPAAWDVFATNDFWAHFDYSAVPAGFEPGGPPGNFPLPTGVSFVGIDSLDNSLGATTSLGSPTRRFGFNPLTGFSREHTSTAATRLFIGRFLQGETSHPNFNWPMSASRNAAADNVLLASAGPTGAVNAGPIIGNGNPMDLAGMPVTLNAAGVVTQFQGTNGRGGPRAVEDLLMPNVHGFRVEIWDSRLQRFVEPGHSYLGQILDATNSLQTTAGDYHYSRRLNTAHGPLGLTGATPATSPNRVFDTWHPGVESLGAVFDYDGDSALENSELAPPFLPLRYYPPRETDPPVASGASYSQPSGPGPMPAGMTNPYLEYDEESGRNQQNKGFWVGSDFQDPDPMNWIYHTYNVGDVVFARPVFDGNDGSPPGSVEIFEWNTAGDDLHPAGFHIAYRCIQAGYAGDGTPAGPYGANIGDQPAWPRKAGQVISEEAQTGAAGTPAIWESFDNRRPLKSIRVTLQFFDQSTEKLRQMSLIVPLTKEEF